MDTLAAAAVLKAATTCVCCRSQLRSMGRQLPIKMSKICIISLTQTANIKACRNIEKVGSFPPKVC